MNGHLKEEGEVKKKRVAGVRKRQDSVEKKKKVGRGHTSFMKTPDSGNLR
jgi:hypothetical protein